MVPAIHGWVLIENGSGLEAKHGHVYLLLFRVLREAKRNTCNAEDSDTYNTWTVFMIYSMIRYVLSLRENENLLLDRDELNKHW